MSPAAVNRAFNSGAISFRISVSPIGLGILIQSLPQGILTASTAVSNALLRVNF